MKKLIFTIFLIFTINSNAQEVETNKATVNYLLSQINTLHFKLVTEKKYLAFLGREGYMEVYWTKEIKSDCIIYEQIIINKEIDMMAYGHNITTDVNGENAKGKSKLKLNYKKL